MVEPLLPVPPRPPYGGRRRAIPDRNCFAAIVYTARTSSCWSPARSSAATGARVVPWLLIGVLGGRRPRWTLHARAAAQRCLGGLHRLVHHRQQLGTKRGQVEL